MRNLATKTTGSRVRFGDVVRLCTERCADLATSGIDRFVGLEHLEPGDLRVRNWGLVAEGTTFANCFKPGQVLFGKRRAYQRKVAVADFDGVCSGDIYVLEPANGSLHPQLLPFLCQTDAFFEHAVGTSAGSLSPRTNWKSLADFEFVLPPVEEQQRLVGILEAGQALLESRVEVHVAAQQLRRSLQKRFFFESPEGDECEIGSVAEVRNGSTPSRDRPEYWGGDVPWLPTGKVNERLISAADEFITPKALRECSVSIIPAGSTLVAMIGEGQTRGKVALLGIGACINQNFGAVTPSDRVDGKYLFYYLESQYEPLRHWSQGTNQHALNCSLIRAFRIRVPSLDRQREIAEMIKAADEGALVAADHLERSQKLARELREFLVTGGGR